MSWQGNFQLVCIFACLIAISCSKPQSTLKSVDQGVHSHYTRRSNADSVIVFVHGIFGDAMSTWTNAQSHAFWPDLLTADDAFTDADIYVLSFTSPYLRWASTIDELVEQAHQDLIADEVLAKHKRVVFVCHSMGGLITRKLLTRYQPIARNVPLIFFYATPTEGAEITRLAQALSNNPQIGGMLPAEADNYVTLVQRDWRGARFRTVSRCAYEQNPTHGIRIVSQMSASQLCDGPVLPIARDHIDIVKPLDRSDKSYLAFRTAYLEAKSLTQPDVASASSPPVTEVTTAALTTKLIDVPCGGVNDQSITISCLSSQKAGHRMVDAIVSIQQASNLKFQWAEVKDRTATDVVVHYKIVGLDPDSSGRCSSNGQATLTLAFLLAGPPAAETADRAQTRITQITQGDMSPAIAGVGGNVTIFRNNEPIVGASSSSIVTTPAIPQVNPLSLATNAGMQGLLLNQHTRGALSPAFAAIGGSVIVQDNAALIKNKTGR